MGVGGGVSLALGLETTLPGVQISTRKVVDVTGKQDLS